MNSWLMFVKVSNISLMASNICRKRLSTATPFLKQQERSFYLKKPSIMGRGKKPSKKCSQHFVFQLMRKNASVEERLWSQPRSPNFQESAVDLASLNWLVPGETVRRVGWVNTTSPHRYFLSRNNMQSKIQQCMFRICGKYPKMGYLAHCEVLSCAWFSFPFLTLQIEHLASVCV